MAVNKIVITRVALRVTYLRIPLFLIAVCIFSVSSEAQTTNLVTAPVDPANRVVLRGQRAPWALPRNSQGPVPSDTMLRHLTLVLKRSPQQQKAFEQFLQQLQDPGSRDYHRFLTPIQIGKRFGASPHDIDAISEWLRAQGLRVDSVANSRMMVDFSGTAALAGAAFGTEMRDYLVDGERRMAAADDPKIPAALAPVIQSVSGLYTVRDHAYHGARPAQIAVKGAASDSPAFSLCDDGSCVYFIAPLDFVTIYDLASVWNQNIDGTGQTIAIIGRAEVYLPDVENFESLSGLAVKDPAIIVPPDGLDPGPPAGAGGTASSDQVEATIDVMRSTSVAPGATIDLVVSADDGGTSGLRIAAAYVVDNNLAQIVNVSFGACEADRTLADVQFWDSLFSQAAGQGISAFVASGDAGAAGCDTYFDIPPPDQILSTNYICASSYSTCVGGTEFADTADPSAYWSQVSNVAPPYESALSYIPEGGWNEPLVGTETQAAASGGGFSVYIPTPPWQTGAGVPGKEGRYEPDVAFSSSAHDGYFGCLQASGSPSGNGCVVQDGQFNFEYFFGTSNAAPAMAGITALLNQKLQSSQGELNQRLYQLGANPANAVFHDVTVASSGVSGCVVTTPSMCNNSTPSPTGLTGGLGGYSVTAGYDEVTGLGSIDVANLLANFATSATTTAVTSSQNPQTYAGAVSFTASVTTAGSNPPTGTVTFNDGATTLGAQTLNGSQLATFTTYVLAAGAHAITAVYGGDANNAASTSPVLTQTIDAAATTSSLTSSASAIPSGVSVTFTAVVTPSAGLSTGTGPPTGMVTFYNGANSLGVGTLNAAGAASVSTTALVAIGSDSISAVYAGDANYLGSTSQTLTQTVSAATFTIGATPMTQTISSGGTATITVTVTPQGNYTSPITFAATLTPTSSAQVSFNPATLTPNAGVASVKLTIQGATSQAMQRAEGGWKLSALNKSFPWTPIGLAGILLLGNRKIGHRKKSDRRLRCHRLRGLTVPAFAVTVSVALVLIALTTFGCGGAGSTARATQTYQVQIAATAAGGGNSGAVTTSATIAFTVQ